MSTSIWIAPLVQLLKILADITRKVIRVRNQQKRQKEANKAHSDPASAFTSHFDGKLRKLPHEGAEA